MWHDRGMIAQSPFSALASDDYHVEVDWRGESAYYVEASRKVWLRLFRQPGGRAILNHSYGVWEYVNGHREELSSLERAQVLQRARHFVCEHYRVVLTAVPPQEDEQENSLEMYTSCCS